MATVYTSDSLRNLFQSSFNLAQWYSFLQYFFNASELKEKPERIIESTSDEGYYLGNINTIDSYRIGLFHYNIRQGSVANKRVGLRNLVKSFINPTWGEFDAALVVFDSGDHWRLSFICDIKGEATSPKRYTYVFGSDDLLYRTPIERFNFLKKKGISFENLKTAFSVEALSDEFFDKYREQYADFVQYVTGKRFVKVGSKWEEKVLGEPNTALMQAFNHNEKKIRDYVKKMMGRITFLHFLQRKGWMCGDLNYMQNMFEGSPYKDDYLDSVLEPLFFGILNTKPTERENLFADYGWDKSLLDEWKDIPYLNGGLFERDEEDEPESRFPADYFKRLFQFFSEYNFTIDENDPNDAEVGVDPEMLGKIFENLLEDNKDKGAFYTPKEIVRYMCKESLIAYLETNTSIAKEKIRQFVLSPEEGVVDIPENKKSKLLTALEEVKICDPAIGSGAFPMGLLNELLHCREALSGERYDRAEIKKSIIQNNIYGVDIEKGAVDIARLRFWLSIVVDEETPSPLPNLDYKIMQGNSLIESFMGVDLSKLTYEKGHKKDKGEISLFDDEKNRLQKTVSQLLMAYYSCSDHDRKVKLQQEISDTINKQLEAQAYDPAILSILKTINLADNNKFFLWHTWFSDVFSRPSDCNGFDIVIGNPPYVNIEYIPDEDRKIYKKVCTCFEKRADLFSVFLEKSLTSLSNSKGVVTFIIPSVIHSNLSYKKLRNLFLDNKWLSEVCYTGGDVFHAPTVDTTILRMQKDGNSQIVLKKALDFANPKISVVNADFFSRFNNIISLGDDSTNSLMVKLFNNKFKQLSEDYAVFQGIVTGNNPAFIFDTEEQAIAKGIDVDLLHPLCHGRDIEKYSVRSRNRRILYVNNDIDIEKWSGTKNWLLNFKEKLETRREVKRNVIRWYSLQWPRVKSELDLKEKIWIQRTRNESLKTRIVAVLDNHAGYTSEGILNVIPINDTANLHFLLGILNSRLINYLFATKFLNLAVKAEYLKQLRIPILSPASQQPINQLVNSILATKQENPVADTSEQEHEIDKIVYQLYGLTDDEIKIIEQQ